MSRIDLVVDTAEALERVAKSVEPLVTYFGDFAAAMLGLAETVRDLLAAVQPETPPAPPPPSYDDARVVLAGKSKAGHGASVRDVIRKHGGEKLSDVPPESLAALIADAEAIS
jgi:hypothetical protein